MHRHLGCATMLEYLELVLGYAPRTARDRIRVAEELVDLPKLHAALADGTLAYSAVRELSRKLDAATEETWIAAARGKTVREVEELLAGRERGDLPDGPRGPDVRPRVLRFEVSPETYALFREARKEIGADSDDALFAMLCRRALGEPEAAPYQISVTTCRDCQRAWQTGAGEQVEVAPEVVEQARCDAQDIGRIDGEMERAHHTVSPATRRLIFARFHHRCAVPACRSARHLEIHHIDPDGGSAPENLVLLRDGHHTAHHRGALAIGGRSPDALTFQHTAEIEADVRAGLQGLGFDAKTCRRAAAEAVARAGHGATLEQTFRAALRRASPRIT